MVNGFLLITLPFILSYSWIYIATYEKVTGEKVAEAPKEKPLTVKEAEKWKKIKGLPAAIIKAGKESFKKVSNLTDYLAKLNLNKDQKETLVAAIFKDDINFDITKPGKKEFIKKCVAIYKTTPKKERLTDKDAWVASIAAAKKPELQLLSIDNKSVKEVEDAEGPPE